MEVQTFIIIGNMHAAHKHSLICTLAILLTGCSIATGSKFTNQPTPKNNEATIYIYRPQTIIGSAQKPDIKINQTPIGTLYNGGFLVAKVPFGQHKITLSGNGNHHKWSYPDHSINLPISKSGNFYLRYTSSSRGGGYSGNQHIIIHSYKFDPAPEASALEELQDLHHSE